MAYAGAPRYPSAAADPAPLGKPLHFDFSGRTAPNRFLKGAMSESLSSWNNQDRKTSGVPSPELVEVYRRWGEGGFGLILSGNTMIAYDQLEGPGNLIIPPDAPFSGPRFDAFKAMATAGKVGGGLILSQLSHPGRQTNEALQPNPVSASDVKLDIEMFGNKFAKPHAASHEEIKAIVEGFAHAAEFLAKAGWDGVQLHGAHGYLLAQFLAETTNKRTDEYGGSLEQRAKIILDVNAAIRARVPKDFVIGIKVNSVEFQEKGLTPQEAKQLVKLLEDNKFDFVELSGGTYEVMAFEHKRESSKKRESFFVEFADEIVPALTKTKAYVTGGFHTVGAMVDALKTVHGVGLGRPATQEPRLPNDILSGKVQGVLLQKIDAGNFGLSHVVAGTQIKQMGEGKEPMDTSNEAVVKGFEQDMGTWMAEAAEQKLNKTGFVTLKNVVQVPYGTAT